MADGCEHGVARCAVPLTIVTGTAYVGNYAGSDGKPHILHSMLMADVAGGALPAATGTRYYS